MNRPPRRVPAMALAAAAAVLVTSPGCLVNRHGKFGLTDVSARAELAGATIVFSRGDGLYLARGDGSDAARLVSSGQVGRNGAIFMPDLDGDGRRILFLSVEDLEVRESTGRDLSLNIVTLTAPAARGAAIESWLKVRLEKIVPPPAGGRQEIFAVAAAAWSRGGGRIALGLNRPDSEGGDAVALFDADGRPVELYRLAGRDLAKVSSLSWTIDDGGILLGLEGEGESSGRVARLTLAGRDGDASGAESVVDLGPGRYPALSADGTRIAVVDDRAGPGDLVVLGPDGTELERYARPAGRAPSRPFWSPGGRYLYYYSLAATGPLGLIDVTILRCLDTRTRHVFDLIRLG